MSNDSTMSKPPRIASLTAPPAPAEVNQPLLVPRLLSMGKAVRALMGLKLSELGIHSGQDELLLRLEEGVPISVSMLADVLTVRPSTVSKMLDRLAEAGLVKRTVDVRDARRTMVVVTPAGNEMRERIMDAWRWMEGQLGDLDDPKATAEAIDEIQQLVAARLRRHR